MRTKQTYNERNEYMTHLHEKDYGKEMKQSFIDYAMKTITDRALPDVRDGLKPVHRRILYGMKAMGLTSDKAHKKSARIVGDVMGKYHPHGDSSVYESMVRLSQDFSVRLPLVDGHGNFGSIDGDEAAAMRYTEARLSKEANWLLDGLEKNMVDFRPNYDDSEKEPVVLPARFPHLLINGSEGIATGMVTNIPTHNPNEVADAWLYVLKHKNPTIKGIMKHLSAPDFPKGSVIANEEEMKSFYKTGTSRVITRGDYTIEDAPYGKKNVVFHKLPAKAVGSKGNLVNHLIEKVNNKTLNEVTDIRDESSKEGVRLVIELRKGVDVSAFLNKLWVKTNMQDSQRLHFLVLVDGQPQTINILDYFNYFTAFQKELIVRDHTFLLNKVQKRLHLVKGYLYAHEHMDAIIDTIRGSETIEDSRNCLMSGSTDGITFKLKKNEKEAIRFSFSKEQAEAILSMRLQKLVGMEKASLEKEKKELEKKETQYKEILKSEEKQVKLCIDEAKKFKDTFGVTATRMTTITTKSTKAVEVEVDKRDVVAIVDRFGLVKLVDKKETNDETILFQLDTNTLSKVAVFTNKGNMYQVKCKDIPEGKKSDRGVPIQLLAKMSPDETILFATTDDDIDKQSFIFVSQKGKGKLVEGKEFETNRTQLLASKIQNKDELVAVLPYSGKSELRIQTYKEKEYDVLVKDIPSYGRNAIGNYLLRLSKEDRITKVSFK